MNNEQFDVDKQLKEVLKASNDEEKEYDEAMKERHDIEVKAIRKETLITLLPYTEYDDGFDDIETCRVMGFNECRKKIINQAKELYNIKL